MIVKLPSDPPKTSTRNKLLCREGLSGRVFHGLLFYFNFFLFSKEDHSCYLFTI